MLRKLSRSHGACPVECHSINRFSGMDIIHTITKLKDMMAKKDWFDLSVRLRRFLMTRQHIFYGFKWTQQCGQWVPILIKNKDVYKRWPAESRKYWKLFVRQSQRIEFDNHREHNVPFTPKSDYELGYTIGYRQGIRDGSR